MSTIAQEIANQVKQLLEKGLGLPPQPAKGGQSYIIRQERIRREGSPTYTYTLPITAAGIRVDVVIEKVFPQAMKYAPLNFIEITNNGLTDLRLRLNGGGGDNYLIPAGVIKAIGKRYFNQFSIENLDTVAATVLGKVEVVLKRSAKTINDMAAENG